MVPCEKLLRPSTRQASRDLRLLNFTPRDLNGLLHICLCVCLSLQKAKSTCEGDWTLIKSNVLISSNNTKIGWSELETDLEVWMTEWEWILKFSLYYTKIFQLNSVSVSVCVSLSCPRLKGWSDYEPLDDIDVDIQLSRCTVPRLNWSIGLQLVKAEPKIIRKSPPALVHIDFFHCKMTSDYAAMKFILMPLQHHWKAEFVRQRSDQSLFTL